MTKKLADIGTLRSGIYEKPSPVANALYLQAVHFTRQGNFDSSVAPQVQLEVRHKRHLLSTGDLLFAAKGLNNFAVVYDKKIGLAVASSSFIVIQINDKNLVLPHYLAWYINHNKQIRLFHDQQLGTTIPSINMTQLGALEVEVPPVDVQQKIVDFQQLREHEKQLIAALETQKEKLYQYSLDKAITP